MAKHAGSYVFLLLFILLAAQLQAAAPVYSFSPSGKDGGGGQSAVACDPNNPGTIIAGGDIWGLWRSTNYGADFQPVSVAASGSAFANENHYKVAAVKWSAKSTTPNRVYACVGRMGTGGGVLRSDDGGLTWTMKSTTPQFAGSNAAESDPLPQSGHPRSVGNLIALDGTQSNEYVYVGTYKQGLMRSTGTDPGASWTTITLSGLSTPYIRGLAIDEASPQTLYVGTFDTDADGVVESIYKLTAARTASTASPITPAPPFLQAEEMVVINGVLYVAANDPTASKRGVYRYDGAWTKIYDDAGASEMYSIDGYWNSSTGKAVVYVGTTDQAKAVGGGTNLFYSVIRSNNASEPTVTWTCLSDDTSKIYTDITMAGPLGNGDHTNETWWHSDTQNALLGGGTFVACQTVLDSSDSTHKRLYVAGRAGMWRTDDATVADPYWYPCMRHMNATVTNEIVADPNNVNRVYCTDYDWTFQYSTDKMSHITPKATGIGAGEEWGVALDSTTNPGSLSAVYMGRGNNIAYSANPASSGWTAIGPTGGFSGDVKGVSVKYISGMGTVVLAAVNNGGIWRKIGAGNTGTWGQVYTGGNVMLNIGTSDKETIISWAGGNSQVVYLDDRENGVYRSLDAGQTWLKITAPTGGWTGSGQFSGCVAVDPNNPANCYVTDDDGIWFSSNANVAGQPTFDPVTISAMGTAQAGLVAYDDDSNVYINSQPNGSTPAKLFFKAAGDSTWYNIATDNAFKAQASFTKAMSIGPGPDHIIYMCGNFTGAVVGTQNDTTPPGNVTNLSATPGEGEIALAWTNPGAGDFAGVRIKRSTVSPPSSPTSGTTVYEGTGTSYTDTGLTEHVTYYYTVFSKDGVPNWSSGVSISEAPVDLTAPASVSNISAVPGDCQVALSWTNPSDSDFAGVLIKRKTNGYPSGPTDGWTVYTGTGTSVTNSALENGVDYYYSIFAYDEVPNYASSANVMATPIDNVATGPVTNLSAQAAAAGNQVNLTWTNPVDSDFALTIIRRATTGYPASPTAGTAVYSGSGTSISDTGLTDGTLYYYSAWAQDQAGNNSVVAQVSCTPADSTAPAAVTNFNVVNGDTEATLSWNNPADADFAGVVIRRRDDTYPTGPTDGFSVYSGTGESVVKTGLTNGQTYFYSIFTKDEVPNYSAAVQNFAVPADVTAPAPVTNVTAVSGDGQVALSWTNPADSDFAGVVIKRKTNGYPTSPTDGWTFYTGTASSATNSGLVNGTTYYYSIFAYDEVPNYAASGDALGKPVDLVPPGPVTAFTATADPAGNKVNLTWTNPTDADYATTIIRRKTGSYPTSPTDGTSVYSGTGTSVSDTGLTDGTLYYYAAWAQDANNNTSSAAQKTCTPADTTAPGPVTGLTATAGIQQVVLAWTNPATADFAGVNVRRKAGSYPTSPTDGTGIYSGTGTTYTDGGLTTGTTYFYNVYAKDEVPNYSTAAQGNARPYLQMTFVSQGANDGWVLENTETSNTGGTMDAAATGNYAIRMGDSATDQQYKSVVSFDTSALSGKTLLQATLQMTCAAPVNTNPFTDARFGACQVDIKNGTFSNAALELSDFQTAASSNNVGQLSSASADGELSTANLNSTGLSNINKTGTTQLKLHFAVDDNDNGVNDVIKFYSGENANSNYRPKLVVNYY